VPGRPVGIRRAAQGFHSVAFSPYGCIDRAARPYRCYPSREDVFIQNPYRCHEIRLVYIMIVFYNLLFAYGTRSFYDNPDLRRNEVLRLLQFPSI
jgi:hypothetical protein